MITPPPVAARTTVVYGKVSLTWTYAAERISKLGRLLHGFIAADDMVHCAGDLARRIGRAGCRSDLHQARHCRRHRLHCGEAEKAQCGSPAGVTGQTEAAR